MSMPASAYGMKPWDIDQDRWGRCMAEAAASMIAQGRHPRTLCPLVQAKRASRLFSARAKR